MARMKSGSPWLYSETGDIIGVKDSDGGETLLLTLEPTGVRKGGEPLTAEEKGVFNADLGTGGGGGITDGDKGDVTVSGSGTVWTVDNDAVTNAKLANMANATIKGRSTAGTGDPEDLIPSQVRTLLNVASGATANSSDATLLARSNHTGTQAASTISDFNSASRAQTEAELIAGTNITITPGSSGATRTLTIAASGGSGSVTSVAATVPTGLSIAGSPVTTTGTLAISLTAGYVIPTQAALDAKLNASLATEITTAKTSFSNADKGILLDAAASDAAKTFTGAVMRTTPVGSALGTTGTVNLDFAALVGTLQTITATGNITFTASNYAAGLSFELRIDAGGGTRTLAWPAWLAYGSALPTSLTSGKVLTVAIRSSGTTAGATDATSALSV